MPMTVSAEYRSNVRKPDDFDAFWDDVLGQASAIPLDAEVVPDPLRTSEDVEVFQVFYTSLDHVRIAAWYFTSGATHVVTTPALFHETVALAPRTQAYPLEEINDYLRVFPARAESVRRTLASFDLCAFAPRVTATTLVMAGAPGTLLDGPALRPLLSALGGPVTVHASEQSTYKDGLYAERWMAAQCGITDVEAILPEHWRTK